MHGEQLHHALDYAAKYDTNLHTKCNESIVPFLCTAANADDIQIRTRAVEMFNHMLLMESKVKWEVFTHEISKIPREVHIIKELIHRMMDIKNAIKLRAIYGLRQAFLKGSQNTTEILTEGIRFANFEDDNVDLPIEPRLRFGEIRYEQPKSLKLAYIHESHKLIQPYFCKLPSILYHLLDNPFPHIRRASLILIENIVLLNPCIVYKTRFVQVKYYYVISKRK